MAIRNSDGSIYRLSGPDPSITPREEWDMSQIKLINFKWNQESVRDKNNPVQKKKENLIDIAKELNLEEDKSKIVYANDFMNTIVAAKQHETPEKKSDIIPKHEPVSPPPQSEPVSQMVITSDENTIKLLKERGVEFYCVPVIEQKILRDELYNTTKTKNIYGNQFIFDAIIIDETDFQLQFWCVREIANNSIVYKRSQGGDRWWKITQNQPKTGGTIYIAMISDLNPSFA